jgi:hypothetical protein
VKRGQDQQNKEEEQEKYLRDSAPRVEPGPDQKFSFATRSVSARDTMEKAGRVEPAADTATAEGISCSREMIGLQAGSKQ